MVIMARRDQDAVFQVALLRIALTLKKEPDASLDDVIERTAKVLKLPRVQFRNYLTSNMALLTARDFSRARRASGVEAAVGTVSVNASGGIRRRVKSRSPR
jgi:hypothetical protein